MRLCDFDALKHLAPLALPLALAAAAGAQDSVSATPGTPDALSSYDASVQTTRYVVDLSPIQSSWGNAFAVAPIVKASSDPDPMFDTQLIGAVAVSPDRLDNVTLPMATDYALWSTSGAGVNPALNSPAPPVSVEAFEQQFALGIADLSSGPTNAIGATVGRTGEPNRLYVSRTVGAVSRFNAGTVDNATLSLGAIDANGLLFLRADPFNTDASSSAVLGDNIVSVDLPARAGFINAILSNTGSNTAIDASATDFLIDDSAVTLNTPSLQPGADAAVALDFAGRAHTRDRRRIERHHIAHRAGHRRPPGQPLRDDHPHLPGRLRARLTGPVCRGGRRDGLDQRLLTRRLGQRARDRFGHAPLADHRRRGLHRKRRGRRQLPPVPLPAVLPRRQRTGGRRLGRVRADPRRRHGVRPVGGRFRRRRHARGGGGWTVASHEGRPVLDGPGGTPVGTIAATPPSSISAPALDELGNVYFVAAFDPDGERVMERSPTR